MNKGITSADITATPPAKAAWYAADPAAVVVSASTTAPHRAASGPAITAANRNPTPARGRGTEA